MLWRKHRNESGSMSPITKFQHSPVSLPYLVMRCLFSKLFNDAVEYWDYITPVTKKYENTSRMILTGWNGSNRKTTGSRASLFNTKPTWTCLRMTLRNRGDSDEKSPEPWPGIIIILIIIIIFVISFMEGIYIATPETKLVSMVVFQLFCIYNLYHMLYYFACQMFFTFT